MGGRQKREYKRIDNRTWSQDGKVVLEIDVIETWLVISVDFLVNQASPHV